MTAMTLWGENQKSAKPILRKRELSLNRQILPGRDPPRHSHAPNWDWDPKIEGLSPHPWQSHLWGVPQKGSAHSEVSISRPNPQCPPPRPQTPGSATHRDTSILRVLSREALGTWLLNEVTSPKCHPEGQRGLVLLSAPTHRQTTHAKEGVHPSPHRVSLAGDHWKPIQGWQGDQGRADLSTPTS